MPGIFGLGSKSPARDAAALLEEMASRLKHYSSYVEHLHVEGAAGELRVRAGDGQDAGHGGARLDDAAVADAAGDGAAALERAGRELEVARP